MYHFLNFPYIIIFKNYNTYSEILQNVAGNYVVTITLLLSLVQLYATVNIIIDAFDIAVIGVN